MSSIELKTGIFKLRAKSTSRSAPNESRPYLKIPSQQFTNSKSSCIQNSYGLGETSFQKKERCGTKGANPLSASLFAYRIASFTLIAHLLCYMEQQYKF